MNPIYSSDDYPRDGCEIVIKIKDGKCYMVIYAPKNEAMCRKARKLEAYGPSIEDAPRVLGEWLSGIAPSKPIR